MNVQIYPFRGLGVSPKAINAERLAVVNLGRDAQATLRKSFDEHRVAIAEKAIALLDRELVEPPLLIQSNQRRDHRDQCAAGQMKVRDHRADMLPPIRRINEN